MVVRKGRLLLRFIRRNWCLILVSFLCLILMFTLYDTSGTGSESTARSSKNPGLRVGFSQIETDNPWRTAQINSFREALIPNGMDFVYHEPEEYTVNWQVENIYRLIAENVDYLVIVPTDIAALTPVFQAAKEADIPVILIDQAAEAVDKSYYVSLISADYLKEGEICARLLAEKSGGAPCNIVEIYGPETSPGAQARSKGFHNALSLYPNLKIIDMEYGNFDRVTAQKAMESALILPISPSYPSTESRMCVRPSLQANT